MVNSRTTPELHTSFKCQARACSLHHHQDMALQHFSSFFLLRSQEHSETAESLMFLQNQRGGRISFLDIRMSETQEWERGLQATQDALHLEKSVSQSLLDLHHLATESSDAHLCHFWRRATWTSSSSSSRNWGTTSPTCTRWGRQKAAWQSTSLTSSPWAPVTRTEPVLDFPMSSG
ncbi:hypothetical protein JEQ12_019847 [Ovis aries]|uniref:Ferritin n=1 Tax=Ovis aries TaxID=9940 RepID=A0A835ZIP1_SHEEP|nr:hypothetical protein JEQ12_019847 [Ovis aries]